MRRDFGPFGPFGLPRLVFEHAPGGLGPFTYKIRVGPISGDTLRLNGDAAGRKFGGVAVATLRRERRRKR